jgi:hypothetical protein
MLERLTAEDFEPHLHRSFAIGPDDRRWDAELVEIRRLPSSSSVARQPFAVVFRGPATPVQSQGMYRVSRAGWGDVDLFLVPVGDDGTGIQYEAVFG